MRKTLILILIFSCQLAKAQYYNDHFPVGHYEMISKEVLFHVNFFENKEAIIFLQNITEQESKIIYRATYELSGDTVILHPLRLHYEVDSDIDKSFLASVQDPVIMIKGASNNELTTTLPFHYEPSLYYMRPLSSSEIEENTSGSLQKKYKWMPIPEISSLTMEENEEETQIDNTANNDLEEDLEIIPNTDTLFYFTSYKKALKEAKKTNKFLRIYITPKDDECATSLKEYIRKLNEDYQEYPSDFVQQLNTYYVLAILSEDEQKNAKHLGIDHLPAHFVIASDQTLLYAEPAGCSNENPLLFENEDEATDFHAFYLQILLKYNHIAVEPRIKKTDKIDYTVLREYLKNLSNASDIMIPAKNYHHFYFPEAYPDDEDRLFTDSGCYPTAQQIQKSVEMYAAHLKEKPFDSEFAEFLMDHYYFNMFNNNAAVKEIPLSMRYLLQHRDVINAMEAYNPENNMDYNLFKYLRNMLPYQNNPEEPLTEKEVLRIYKEANQLAPEYKDYLMMDVCYYYDGFNSYTGNNAKEILDFYDEYVSDILSQKDIYASLTHKVSVIQPLQPGVFYEMYDYDGEGPIEKCLFTENVAAMIVRLSWIAYEQNIKEYIPKALQWSEIAANKIDNIKKIFYRQSYAFLLYDTGRCEEAIQLQKEIYQSAKNDKDIAPSDLKNIRIHLLTMICDTIKE